MADLAAQVATVAPVEAAAEAGEDAVMAEAEAGGLVVVMEEEEVHRELETTAVHLEAAATQEAPVVAAPVA